MGRDGRRARQLDVARLDEQVGGEWSFIETLRHLVFVTDLWVGEVIEEEPAPHHPWGCRRTSSRLLLSRRWASRSTPARRSTRCAPCATTRSCSGRSACWPGSRPTAWPAPARPATASSRWSARSSASSSRSRAHHQYATRDLAVLEHAPRADPSLRLSPVAAPLFVVVSGPPGAGSPRSPSRWPRELAPAADRQGHDQGGADGLARRAGRRGVEAAGRRRRRGAPGGGRRVRRWARCSTATSGARWPWATSRRPGGAVVEVFCRCRRGRGMGALRGAGWHPPPGPLRRGAIPRRALG